eukprot:403374430
MTSLSLTSGVFNSRTNSKYLFRPKKLLLLTVALICLLSQILCDDYYQTLGLKKGATDAQIKKAFKKMAIKFHPDKNKDDPEGAKKRFQKIANAYETLSDPEKRQIYDQHGEEGVKRQQAGQNAGGGGQFNADDIFNQFFGGGHRQQHQQQHGQGKQHFEFHFGGGHGGHGHQQQQHVEDLFENSDVIKLNLNQIFQFYRRKEIWVMLFYKPGDEESKKLKDEYRTLAEKMYGVVKIGAIDCGEDEELCEEFAIYQVPTIMIFQESYSDEGEKYTGKMDWKSIANFATKKMQSFVSLITSDNYEQFIQRDPIKYKVLLFTERRSTPPIYKALSKQYKDKLMFGEVRKSDTVMINNFQVTEFPKLLVITNPYTFENEKYQGEIKIDRITKFLNNYSYKTMTVQKSLEIVELTEQKFKQGLCKRSSSNVCILLFSDASKKLNEAVLPLLERYQNDKISFAYIDKTKEPEIYDLFSGSQYQMVAYKPKRSKFIGYSNPDYNTDSIKDFIDNIIGGGGGDALRAELNESFFASNSNKHEL